MSAMPAAVSAPAAVHLFVSTALEFWSTDQGAAFARDVQIDDTMYRRLDPEYYAWLRSRMLLAKKAVDAGQLDVAAFDDLRARFNAVQEWAVEHFGEGQLLAAVRTLRAGEYKPPVAEDDRPHAPLPRAAISAGDRVSPEAVAIVDAIAEKAAALGWARERLYAIGNGLFDPQRGLICYLKPGDRIGQVTSQSIEIIHALPSEVRHRFYNPDADQPWIIRVAEQKK
ncbi:MAG TPA: hypothetical protein VFA33_23105 [Bryobacteraceae bacterium]|nr:hypothetical protein [Bryobacteraceae bacterium]